MHMAGRVQKPQRLQRVEQHDSGRLMGSSKMVLHKVEGSTPEAAGTCTVGKVERGSLARVSEREVCRQRPGLVVKGDENEDKMALRVDMIDRIPALALADGRAAVVAVEAG